MDFRADPRREVQKPSGKCFDLRCLGGLVFCSAFLVEAGDLRHYFESQISPEVSPLSVSSSVGPAAIQSAA